MKYNELTLTTKKIPNTEVKIGDILVRNCDSEDIMVVVDANNNVTSLVFPFKVDQIYTQYEIDDLPRCLTIIGHTLTGQWACAKRYIGNDVTLVETNFPF